MPIVKSLPAEARYAPLGILNEPVPVKLEELMPNSAKPKDDVETSLDKFIFADAFVAALLF